MMLVNFIPSPSSDILSYKLLDVLSSNNGGFIHCDLKLHNYVHQICRILNVIIKIATLPE